MAEDLRITIPFGKPGETMLCTVRTITKNTLFVSSINDAQDEIEITNEQIREIARTADQIESLREADKLLPHFVRVLKSDTGLGPTEIWKEAALGIILDYFVEKSLQREGMLWDQIVRGVHVTADSLKTKRTENRDDMFDALIQQARENSLHVNIKTVCPAAGFARLWLTAGWEVIDRAKREHPELF